MGGGEEGGRVYLVVFFKGILVDKLRKGGILRFRCAFALLSCL